MIATSMTRTHDRTRAPAHRAPAFCRAAMRVLSMIGLGIGGVAALDDDPATETN